VLVLKRYAGFEATDFLVDLCCQGEGGAAELPVFGLAQVVGLAEEAFVAPTASLGVPARDAFR
jgi:hypothetical protein